MMSFRSSDALKGFLAVLLLIALPCVSFAQEEGDDNKSAAGNNAAMGTQTIVSAIVAAQEKLGSSLMPVIFEKLKKAIETSTDELKSAVVDMWKEEVRRRTDGLGNSNELLTIAQERAKSAVLTDATRQALDEINYKILEGYREIPGVGFLGNNNPNLGSRFATIGRIYDLHVKLFCDPRGENVPNGCGGDRLTNGINGNENFVDFMLAERTWPKEAVLDTMQVARAYFMEMKPRFSGQNTNNSPASMIAWQRSAARDNIRMSAINMLAARRAPTSMASQEVMRMMLRNFASSGKVSMTDLAKLCAKTNLNDLEAYTCNMTNIPDSSTPNAPRIIGQASIDRVMQHDYYMSPLFYTNLNSDSLGDGVGLERMEVLSISQQLAQDYYFLRMLQIKTALRAIRLAPKD